MKGVFLAIALAVIPTVAQAQRAATEKNKAVDPILAALGESDPLKAAISEIEKRLLEIETSKDTQAKKAAVLKKFFTEFNRKKYEPTVRFRIEDVRGATGRRGPLTLIRLSHSEVPKAFTVEAPPTFESAAKGDSANLTGILTLNDERTFRLSDADARLGKRIAIRSLGQNLFLVLETKAVEFEKAEN